METPNADDLLTDLMEAALPGNVSESLENCKRMSNVQCPIHKKCEHFQVKF